MYIEKTKNREIYNKFYLNMKFIKDKKHTAICITQK